MTALVERSSFHAMQHLARLVLFSVIAGVSDPKGIGAQEDAPAPPHAGAKLADPAAFEAADNDVLEALRGVARSIDEELAAKRVKSGDVMAERSHVEFLLGVGGNGSLWSLDIHARGGSGRDRSANAAIQAARAKFGATLQNRRTLYAERLPETLSAAVHAAAAAWRKSVSATEISAVITHLERVQEIAERAELKPPAKRAREEVRTARDYLEKFKNLIAAEETGDAALIGQASRNVRVSTSPFGDAVSLKELEDRRTAAQARVRERIARAWQKMLEELPKARTPEDADGVVEELRVAAQAEEALTGRLAGEWDQRYSAAERFAREWQGMLTRAAAGDAAGSAKESRRLAEEARALAPALNAALSSWAQEAMRRARELTQSRLQTAGKTVTATLAKAASARDVEHAAASLRELLVEDESAREELRDVAEAVADLEALATAWSDMESQPASSLQSFANSGERRHPWAAATAAVRERLRRKLLADRLGRPELLEPPLNALPATEALRRLAADAGAKGDWRALHDLLKAQATALPHEGPPPELAPVRALLVAQNFEQAEEWSEAVRAYRAVLKAADQPALVTAASDRLRALKQERPDLFQEPKR